MTDSINIANITPSTRDLVQFISPNISKQDTMIQISDLQAKELNQYANKFSEWEDEEISALILQIPRLQSIPGDYLKEAMNTLTCPLIRFASTTDFDDIIQSRALGFDGQILSADCLSDKDISLFWQKAQTMNYRLIFHIKSFEKLAPVLALQPRLIYVDNSANFSQKDLDNTTWVIAKEDYKNDFSPKCLIKNI